MGPHGVKQHLGNPKGVHQDERRLYGGNHTSCLSFQKYRGNTAAEQEYRIPVALQKKNTLRHDMRHYKWALHLRPGGKSLPRPQ